MSTPAQPSFTPGPWTTDGTAITTTGHHPETVATTSPKICGPGMGSALANAALIAASPSLYAYAKAVALRSRWQDERDSIGSTEWADRLREFENHLTSMGWVRGEASDPFLSNYRYAALALAEGGGK